MSELYMTCYVKDKLICAGDFENINDAIYFSTLHIEKGEFPVRIVLEEAKELPNDWQTND